MSSTLDSDPAGFPSAEGRCPGLHCNLGVQETPQRSASAQASACRRHDTSGTTADCSSSVSSAPGPVPGAWPAQGKEWLGGGARDPREGLGSWGVGYYRNLMSMIWSEAKKQELWQLCGRNARQDSQDNLYVEAPMLQAQVLNSIHFNQKFCFFSSLDLH